MSVRLVSYEGGRWEVDIRARLANGQRLRERRVIANRSKSAAKRWGEERERHLLQHGPERETKEVSTVKEFAPRFYGWACAGKSPEAKRHCSDGIHFEMASRPRLW